MAYDMFLQIDGVKGDSTDAAHKEWIEVSSYAHKMSQAQGGAASAQGAHLGGRADHEDFVITKRLDSATPALSLFCCNGKHIANAKLEMCRAMGDKTVFMTYTFKDVVIASISPRGSRNSEDLLPFEEVALRYGEVRWAYTQTKADGTKGATLTQGWSMLQNKAV